MLLIVHAQLRTDSREKEEEEERSNRAFVCEGGSMYVERERERKKRLCRGSNKPIGREISCYPTH